MGSSKLALNVAACGVRPLFPSRPATSRSSRLRRPCDVGMTQLLTEVVTTAIQKDMIEEILREPSPDLAPQAVPESP